MCIETNSQSRNGRDRGSSNTAFGGGCGTGGNGGSKLQIKAEQRKAEQIRRQKERRQIAIEKGRNPDKKRGRNAQIHDEWEDLAKEERLYKKFRRKKITKKQYEEQLFGLSSTSSDKVESGDDSD